MRFGHFRVAKRDAIDGNLHAVRARSVKRPALADGRPEVVDIDDAFGRHCFGLRWIWRIPAFTQYIEARGVNPVVAGRFFSVRLPARVRTRRTQGSWGRCKRIAWARNLPRAPARD